MMSFLVFYLNYQNRLKPNNKYKTSASTFPCLCVHFIINPLLIFFKGYRFSVNKMSYHTMSDEDLWELADHACSPQGEREMCAQPCHPCLSELHPQPFSCLS